MILGLRGFGQAMTLDPALETKMAAFVADPANSTVGLNTANQWAYIANLVDPTAGPFAASGAPGNDPTYTLDQWWTMVAAGTVPPQTAPVIQVGPVVAVPSAQPAPVVSAPVVVAPVVTSAACAFYQTADPVTGACSLNLYLIGALLAGGVILAMSLGKKK
jgi:hypothetical protein